MTAYFSLQYKMANRKLNELGVQPVPGFLLGIAAFVLASEYLFLKTEFAKYIVILTALSLMIRLSERNRTEFLQIVFGDRKSLYIRMLENGLLVLPFSIILLYHKAYPEGVLLLLASPVFAFNTYNTGINFTLPTPFYKRPFEFLTGFRKTFFIFPVAYLLTVIAISVDNFNLGIFALLLIFLVSMSFYTKPENDYYVWSYSAKPQKFLFGKMKTAGIYSVLTALPVVISLIVFYPAKTDVTLLFLLLGTVFLWTTILSKYSVYPNEINIPEVFLIAISIYFPPLLIVLMPFLYFKSVKKLNSLLK